MIKSNIFLASVYCYSLRTEVNFEKNGRGLLLIALDRSNILDKSTNQQENSVETEEVCTFCCSYALAGTLSELNFHFDSSFIKMASLV